MEFRESLYIAGRRMNLDWPEVSEQGKKKVSRDLYNDNGPPRTYLAISI